MRDVQKDYGQFGLNWGYASSPLLVRRFALRSGSPRDEDRRSFLRNANKSHQRKDYLESRAGRRQRFASLRMPTRHRPCSCMARQLRL
jgi:hypothetical protein